MKGEQSNRIRKPDPALIVKHVCNLGYSPEHAKELAAMILNESMAREIDNSVAGNTLVEYPSAKVGRVIECESLTIEYARALQLEFDPDVLWYSTQPTRLVCWYEKSNGAKQSHRFTPDLLVISHDNVWFEEGKRQAELDRLITKGSNIYQRDGESYRHLSGERNRFGIDFRVVTDKDMTRATVANFEFLNAHHVRGEACSEEILLQIQTVLATHKEVTIDQLVNNFGFELRDIHDALAQSQLIWLPNTDRVAEAKCCRIFANTAYAQSALEAPNSREIRVPVGTKVRFGNVDWTLMGWQGKSLELAHDGIRQTVRVDELSAETQKSLQEASIPAPSAATLHLDEMVTKAQERMLALSIWERSGLLPRWENGKTYSVRTLQSWTRQRSLGLAEGKTELEALMPALDRQGSRPKQISAEIEELAKKYIRTRFENATAPTAVAVLKELNADIAERWDDTQQISESTFRRYIGELENYWMTWRRHGRRRANQVRPSNSVVTGEKKQDGDYTFHVIEFDHTFADAIIVDDFGQPLKGRPSLTVALDSYSRYPLCWFVTMDTDSKRNGLERKIDPRAGQEDTFSNRRAAMLLHALIEKYETLPTRIHTDGGTDFEGGVLFDFVRRSGIIKSKRPVGDPTNGPTIERFFKALNEGFLHLIPGNTQDIAPRWSRTNSASHRPEKHASLTLEQLQAGIDFWIENEYKVSEHTGIFTTPTQKFEEGLRKQSDFRHFPYDELDVSRFTATELKNERTIGKDGVKVDGFWYFHEAFRLKKYQNSKIKVRIDPIDISRVFVLIDGRWEPAISQERRSMRDLSLEGRALRSAKIASAARSSRSRKRQEVKAGTKIVASASRPTRASILAALEADAKENVGEEAA